MLLNSTMILDFIVPRSVNMAWQLGKLTVVSLRLAGGTTESSMRVQEINTPEVTVSKQTSKEVPFGGMHSRSGKDGHT